MIKSNVARLAVLFVLFGCPDLVWAQQRPGLNVSAYPDASGQVDFDIQNKTATATNGVLVTYENAVLTAERADVNLVTGEVTAAGRVRLQRDDLVWASESLKYNFLTRKMESEQFRTGKAPAFASGGQIHGELSNKVFVANSAFITTDDVAEPLTRIRASSITVIPGHSFQARNAVLFLGQVPVFYFPFYTQRLDEHGNRFDFVPGYRSRYGAYLLGSYTWFLNDQFDGVVHADYRTKRGGAGGTDFNLHLGRWGESKLKLYYLRDEDPAQDNPGFAIPDNRYRIDFSYDARPLTNFSIKSRVRFQSDERVLYNFMERDYRENPQPSTFLELNPTSENFSLDVYAQPRINEFFENVERLPDVRLTGFRQQVLGSPVYYESETSAAYLRRRFAETNNVLAGLDYAAPRADTYHQLTLPHTFFGWLNVAPRVGGRFTYYGDATGPGATTAALGRSIFNTGAEATFKLSQTWVGLTNRLLALDGLRHLIEPSANYVFVPTPNRAPNELPQFDSELPALRLLPLEFPDYNAIDSVDSASTVRLGLRNRFQTKRSGRIENFVYWDLFVDARLRPTDRQTTFSDVFSDFTIRPRSWFTLESLTRYDVENHRWRLAYHNLTLQPNEVWSWSLGHLYTRDDLSPTATALQGGNSFLTSTLFYRLNENWGLRAVHQYDVRANQLQQQSYSVYRDLRSWTTALTFRLRDAVGQPSDWTVAVTISLKASPKFGVGGDAVRPEGLLGY